MSNLRKIFGFLVFTIIIVAGITNPVQAQDKKERKALEKKAKVQDRQKEQYDSLMTRHYNRQQKAVKKRIRKSYRKARRNHEGKRDPWYVRIVKRRQKKGRSKKRRKKQR